MGPDPASDVSSSESVDSDRVEGGESSPDKFSDRSRVPPLHQSSFSELHINNGQATQSRLPHGTHSGSESLKGDFADFRLLTPPISFEKSIKNTSPQSSALKAKSAAVTQDLGDRRATVSTATVDPGLDSSGNDSLRNRHRADKRHGICAPPVTGVALPSNRDEDQAESSEEQNLRQHKKQPIQPLDQFDLSNNGKSSGGSHFLKKAQPSTQPTSLLHDQHFETSHLSGQHQIAAQKKLADQPQQHAQAPYPALQSQLPVRFSPKKGGKRKASETLDRPPVNSIDGNCNDSLQARTEESGNGAPSSAVASNHQPNFVSSLPQTYSDVPDENSNIHFSDLKEACTDINAEFFAVQDTGLESRPRRQRKKPPREKFTSFLLPPPSHVYVRTNDPNFNIFSDGILRFSDLSFMLADALPLHDLLNLYSTSRQFHQTLNQRFTTMIFGQARAICHDAAIAFPWRCYAQFGRPDPANRIPNPDKAKAEQGIPRAVPSMQWVFFCLFREKAVQEIMAIMAEDGLPLVPGCKMAIMRIWFLMDLPDNGRRISVVHNRFWFTNVTLYYALMFFIKMDMRFNDPLSRRCVRGTKNMLLSQPTLATFWRVLKGEELKTEFEALKMWIAYKYVPRTREEAKLDLFGIPAAEVGRIQYEHWGQRLGRDPKTGENVKPIRMLRPDELVMREVLRRGLGMGPNQWMRLIVWGYVNTETLEDTAPGRMERRLDMPDEYSDDDRVSGAAVGNDPLLDLGHKDRVISSSVLPHQETVNDLEKEQEDKEFLEAMTLIQHEEKLIEIEKRWAKTGNRPKGSTSKNPPYVDVTDEESYGSGSDFATEG